MLFRCHKKVSTCYVIILHLKKNRLIISIPPIMLIWMQKSYLTTFAMRILRWRVLYKNIEVTATKKASIHFITTLWVMFAKKTMVFLLILFPTAPFYTLVFNCLTKTCKWYLDHKSRLRYDYAVILQQLWIIALKVLFWNLIITYL